MQAGFFDVFQSPIASVGAASLTPFGLSVGTDDMLLLGVASRQGNAGAPPQSVLYRYTDGKFAAYQDLTEVGGLSSMAYFEQGGEGYLATAVLGCAGDFAKDACNLHGSSAKIKITPKTPVAFEGMPLPPGGSAAAPAGTVCKSDAVPYPVSVAASPANESPVMQWSKIEKKFMRMPALTDDVHLATYGYAVPEGERSIHFGDVLLSTKNSAHIGVHEVNGVTFLVASTHAAGAVIFDFDIPTVVGLAGPTAIVAEPCGRGAYVAGGADGALSWVRRNDELDSSGRVTRKLSMQGWWSNAALGASRTLRAASFNVEGLKGVRAIEYRPAGACTTDASEVGAAMSLCQLVALSQPPRSMLPCGTRTLRGGFGQEVPACRSPFTDGQLEVLPGETTNLALLVAPPVISAGGELSFEVAAGQSGMATFDISASAPGPFRRLLTSDAGESEDSGPRRSLLSQRSKVAQFTIDVRVPRYKPSFTPLNLTVNEDQGPHTLVFARDLASGVAGSPQDSVLLCRWNLTGYDPRALKTAPLVRTRLVGRELRGTVTFDPAANFNGAINVIAFLTDSSEPDLRLRTSLPRKFTITVNAVNDAPVVEWCGGLIPEQPSGAGAVCNQPSTGLAEVLLLQDAGPVILQSLITLIKIGPVDETAARPQPPCSPTDVCWYGYEVMSVKRATRPTSFGGGALLDSVSPGRVDLRVDLDGSLYVHLGPRVFGTWRVTLRVSDDGGVAHGGANSSDVVFYLTALQVRNFGTVCTG